MKISLNWVKEYTAIKVPKDELLAKIGAQLGEIEEVIELADKYKGIVLAKVMTCEKHPNADKLSICTIDDGGKVKHVKRNSDGLVEIVCGAPNVRAGLLVAWLPPGTVVPATYDKDPFTLEAREIRGKISNGMLASASELAISEDHSGILELNPYDGKPGDDFAEVYYLNDTVVDVENKMFTHRPDCFGILGVAREIAGIQHLPFKSPSWYLDAPKLSAGKALSLEVKIEDTKLVPRFMAVALNVSNQNNGAIWMQTYLSRVGIRPINPIVDITNYVMHLTGQPLHAYDAEKLQKVASSEQRVVSLEARRSEKGEKLKLLSGKEITFDDDSTIVIASGGVPVGVGGVMGGADTEVDENTKNIVLEAASFDMYNIRRTSMKYGLFTDAVTRFNKGQSPEQTDRALAYAVQLIEQLASGKVASKICDKYHKNHKQDNPRVTVTADFINERLGTHLTVKEMTQLLENVEFKIVSAPADKKNFHVQVPFWRTDIEIPEDIVEEVGRLYGYQHVPLELPRRVVIPAERDRLLEAKNAVRGSLAATGANEVLTYTFVHSNLMEKTGQNPDNAFRLTNALSPDLQYYRMSLIPSLLDKVHMNIKAGYDEFVLFEMNPVHNKDLTEEDGLPLEEQRLALVFAAEEKTAAKHYTGASYYQAQKYLTELLAAFGIEPVFQPAIEREPKYEVGKAAIAPFDKNRASYVRTADGTLLGELGEFKASVRKALKLPAFSAGFELDLGRIAEMQQPRTYQPLSRFPKVEQDVSLKVAEKVNYQELVDFVSENLETPVNSTFTLTPIDIYQPDDAAHRHITLRLSLASYERTLKAEEVNRLLDDVAAAAKDKLGAERL